MIVEMKIDLVAISSVVIATCAFFATMYQAYLSRRHNRLSVRPLLVLNNRRDAQGLGCDFQFSISNCGIGPAMIVDRYFLVDGVQFKPAGRARDTVTEVVDHVLKKRYAYELPEHGFPGQKSVFAVDESFTIAKIRFPVANGVILESIMQELDRIALVVTYESMYGEPFELRTD